MHTIDAGVGYRAARVRRRAARAPRRHARGHLLSRRISPSTQRVTLPPYTRVDLSADVRSFRRARGDGVTAHAARRESVRRALHRRRGLQLRLQRARTTRRFAQTGYRGAGASTARGTYACRSERHGCGACAPHARHCRPPVVAFEHGAARHRRDRPPRVRLPRVVAHPPARDARGGRAERAREGRAPLVPALRQRARSVRAGHARSCTSSRAAISTR